MTVSINKCIPIDLDPEFRNRAKTHIDFASIRDGDRFLALLNERTDAALNKYHSKRLGDRLQNY